MNVTIIAWLQARDLLKKQRHRLQAVQAACTADPEAYPDRIKKHESIFMDPDHHLMYCRNAKVRVWFCSLIIIQSLVLLIYYYTIIGSTHWLLYNPWFYHFCWYTFFNNPWLCYHSVFIIMRCHMISIPRSGCLVIKKTNPRISMSLTQVIKMTQTYDFNI